MPSRPSVVRAAATLSAATLAILAACADPARVTAPAAGGLSAARDMEFNSPRHVFHTKQYFAQQDAADGGARYARPTGGGTNTGISYHPGGTVLQNGTNVVAIYWNVPSGTGGYQNLPSGNGPGTADGSLIGTFLTSLDNVIDVAGRNYYNINHTYWGQAGSSALINATVSYTGYWNTVGSGAPLPSTSSTGPTDAEMAALIQWGLNNSKLAYDANTVYAIFTGTSVNLGGGFGSQYCAYHTHASTTRGNVFYAAMPYNQDYPSGCTSQFASLNADKAANSELNTLAHEIEETTTDAMGNAWYDNRGYENADKCAWTWGTMNTGTSGSTTTPTWNQTATVSGTTYHFLVQQNWINANSGGCTTGS